MLDSPTDEIKSKIDIVDLISEYIQLKKVGTNYKALCPFHNEKTPSFLVSQEKQIWHCFGCSEGGDIFGFIMKMEGLEFPEALRLLAGKTGVVLKQQDPSLATKKNQLMDICKLSAKFYHKILLESEAGQKAREYLLKERGLSEETIEDWQIGFAPDSWDNLLNLLKKKGFSEEEIFLAGLSVKKEKGVGYYDRFRNRIMFPISEVHGNIIGFTGRVMPGASEKDPSAARRELADTSSSGQGAAKYINTPQTILYDKSRVLFGLDQARQEIKKQDLVVVVEGQMDIIASHQAGVKNVIASSGTSLTENQVALLKRYSKNIAMAFDMDVAGQSAVLRGIELALASGLNVKVIELPKDKSGQPLYKDPDECVKKDPELWREAINAAKPFMEYLFDLTFAKYNIQKVEEKKLAVYQILKYLNLLPDRIEQGYYFKKLAEIINESEEILREIMPKSRMKAPVKEPVEEIFKGNKREDAISDRLLALCLKEPNFLNYVIENLPTEMVPKIEAKSIYKQLIIYYTNKQADSLDQSIEFDYNEIKTNLNHNEVKYLEGLLLLNEDAFLEEELDLLEDELKDLTREAKKIAISKTLAEIQAKIQQAEKARNNEALEELTHEFNDLLERLNELHHY